jgi:hypothetical protein
VVTISELVKAGFAADTRCTFIPSLYWRSLLNMRFVLQTAFNYGIRFVTVIARWVAKELIERPKPSTKARGKANADASRTPPPNRAYEPPDVGQAGVLCSIAPGVYGQAPFIIF